MPPREYFGNWGSVREVLMKLQATIEAAFPGSIRSSRISCAEESREDLKAKLSVSKPTSNRDDLVNASIHLTASLLLMMEFCSLDYSFSGGEQLHWTEGS